MASNAKDIALLIVFVFFALPFLIKVAIFALKSAIQPEQADIATGVELVAESAIPWWLGPLEWLAGLPGEIAGFSIAGVAIILFFLFLKWIGEVKI
ncbi:hypothetical protein J2755_001616 [Methanohalophilus levihalophilus]|uniref:hypothetical protein n=1 Tax=Methanohalophilus levihalophilus TaxID=1431282 RepID=UPI001AE8C3A7|nr:hypothetical protein [Methanohalophilus levihalophilus]MBP2030668.1 hypothetical protein [Methanohalophilus levihalophilus]